MNTNPALASTLEQKRPRKTHDQRFGVLIKAHARRIPEGQLLVWWEDEEALVCRYIHLQH